MLNCFNLIYVQDSCSQKLLSDINITNSKICGDTRFDRVWEISKKDFSDKFIENFICHNKNVIVAGSTWPADEKALYNFLKLSSNFKLIIAPHEVDAERIKDLYNQFLSFNPILYTDDLENIYDNNHQVLIINKICLLSNLYRYGNYAYVGGGFGKGIHNTLEAACYGVPVVFGPNYQKFIEAKDLIKYGGGFSLSKVENLYELLSSIDREKAGIAAKNYVETKIAVADKIFDDLNKFDIF